MPNAIFQGILVVPALSEGIPLDSKELKSDRRVGGLIEQITNVVFEYRSNLPESFIHTISPSFKLRLHPPHNPQRGFRPVSRPRRELDRPLNPSGSTPDPAFGAI
jgi:hypothetical protein